jgi:ABC-2 type transport system ATP-binding protein
VTPTASGGNSAIACASRRAFLIHVRAPKGTRLRSATLYVAGKRVTRLSGRRRLRSGISLRGLPKGAFTVRVEAVTTTGRHLVDLRRYRTCAAKRKTKPKKHTLGHKH